MSDIDTHAKAIFFEALDRATPEQLIAYLDEACGDDTELRGRVDDLLRAHQDAGKFLGGSASAIATIDLPPIAERPGTEIGPYTVNPECNVISRAFSSGKCEWREEMSM